MAASRREFLAAMAVAGAGVLTPSLSGVREALAHAESVQSGSTPVRFAALTPAGLAAARESVAQLVAERTRLAAALAKLPAVKRVWPSDANYILIEVADSARVMAAGRTAGIIWRDRSKDVPNTIRLTVGTAEENNETLEVLSRV